MVTAPGQPAASIAHRRRAAALGGFLTIALVVAATVAAHTLVAQIADLEARPRLAVEDAVVPIALAVMAAALGWLALVVAASSAGLLRPARPRVTRAGMPLAARVASVLLAATALGSVGATAQAVAPSAAVLTVEQLHPADEPPHRLPDFAPAPAGADPSDGTAHATCDPPEPGWTTSGPRLQRPATTDQAGLLDRCAAGSRGQDVVVHRGDSLWSIVARDLGPDASAAQIAATWPAWHAANRDAIGSDPDVLLPGTTLHRPAQEVRR